MVAVEVGVGVVAVWVGGVVVVGVVVVVVVVVVWVVWVVAGVEGAAGRHCETASDTT